MALLGAFTWAPDPEGQIDGPQITGILPNYRHNHHCKMNHQRLASNVSVEQLHTYRSSRDLSFLLKYEKAAAKDINSSEAKL